ncbi:hypothetical protein N7462_011694 [Penicillium macrosclerotiorum]|uniref:uncharacterized protein n=1 Tax=Penicillium macrosclerotiorum TaxID=303699 RepID=UPI002546AFA2|nr:uncharacterized protein N7462_011694 [Penicillium macrosclerotiorum]KAJ5662768.1 hypothetical protein N7462_011694 [Penicillium macrosclerotiorum]
MLRLFNRFYALCGIAACTILYSAWFLTFRNFGDIVPLGSEQFRTATSFDQRLVVFGDSWSDNDTEEPQGQVWTDWLCEMFSCHQENLAQTAKSVLRGKYAGSVVDNTELDLTSRLSQTRLADFKTQLDQWMNAESSSLEGFSAEQIQDRHDRTIFVVSFGVWDIWNLVSKDYDSASTAVGRRIGTLVEQLNKLADRWGSMQLKVILTQTVDVTFLPGFTATGGDEYKGAIKILELWNRKLREAAKEWDRGTIYLFDTNAFVMDRIRDWQLYAAGIEEENGLGTNREPGWENVVDACVETASGIKVMMSKDKGKQKQCEHPDKYLFWNEMHLGPSAHRLMATEIYHGIDGVLLNSKAPVPDEGSQSQAQSEAPHERHNRRSFAA